MELLLLSNSTLPGKAWLERGRQPCLPDYPHDQRYADRRSKRFRRAGSVPAAN